MKSTGETLTGVILDLDGTIYRGNTLIPGADRFVRKLRESGIPYLFVTNNSSRTPESVSAHLNEMGVEARPEHVYTSALAAAEYVAEQKIGQRAFVVGESGLLQALKQKGIQPVTDRPDCVVQGIDRRFDYDKLAEAVRHIRSGCPYILTNPDVLLPTDQGFLPGAGSLAAAIRASAQQEPVVIGKPSATILTYALPRMGLPASSVWVVGDNIRTDMAAGKAAGCRTALILTGVTGKDQVEAECEATGCRPDFIGHRLEEWLAHISGERWEDT